MAASGIVRLDRKSEILGQTSGVEMFATEEAARASVEVQHAGSNRCCTSEVK